MQATADLNFYLVVHLLCNACGSLIGFKDIPNAPARNISCTKISTIIFVYARYSDWFKDLNESQLSFCGLWERFDVLCRFMPLICFKRRMFVYFNLHMCCSALLSSLHYPMQSRSYYYLIFCVLDSFLSCVKQHPCPATVSNIGLFDLVMKWLLLCSLFS